MGTASGLIAAVAGDGGHTGSGYVSSRRAVSMDEKYVCDRCERQFPITQVMIDGDIVICEACQS